MTIFLAADHRGFQLKEQLKSWLSSQNYSVTDCGNDHLEPTDDFVDFTAIAAQKLLTDLRSASDQPPSADASSASDQPPRPLDQPTSASDQPPTASDQPTSADATQATHDKSLGIVLCGSGIGAAIAANRLRGIRCALCVTPNHAAHARRNDHANMLSLPADMLSLEDAQSIITSFLTTEPSQEEKYIRRSQKLDQIATEPHQS